mgnify:CR=1 FL=1
MLEAVDENTIGVVPILGVTYNGLYEPVKDLASALDELAAGGGPEATPIFRASVSGPCCSATSAAVNGAALAPSTKGIFVSPAS